MEKTFSFDTIGKKMPYTVPEGFFEDLEAKVLSEVKPEASPLPRKRNVKTIRLILAVAAAITLLMVLNVSLWRNHTTDAQEVEQAFSELTHDDQDFLLAVYQNDVFINGQE